MLTDTRQLRDLVSVGPATLADFELLGIYSVGQLRKRSSQRMYRELCRIRKERIDPGCLDVFVAAVAQAKNRNLPVEQRQWWFWSRVRKRKSVQGLVGISRLGAREAGDSLK
jgi:hypothetical protein